MAGGSPAGAADSAVLDWLLAGDVSVQYQVRRDLLGEDRPGLRARIATEGWGAALLAARNADGSWDRGFYQRKWTSSHYTLLDLKTLGIDPAHPLLRGSVAKIAAEEKRPDGGLGPAKSYPQSDACVAGMFLNYASYFGLPGPDLRSVVDFLIGQQMRDGGFNCRLNTTGAVHSSLHSTVSVLEGIAQYTASGHGYRGEELQAIAMDCIEFILLHRLFKSDRTGQVIRAEFLRLPYPWRWKYNILRALDCLAGMGVPWDGRMQDAIEVLRAKRRPDGRWPQQAAHPGQVHITMEPAGGPGRWNTLIALRVLRAYGDRPGGI